MIEDSYERDNVALILNLWLEDQYEVDSNGLPLWRGHITHVLSGERTHFQDFATLNEILTSYLKEMLSES